MRVWLTVVLTLFFSICYAQTDKHEVLKTAQEQLADKEYDTAYELLCGLIETYPDYDSAYTERAFIYLHRGLPAESIADLDKAIAIDSNNMGAFFLRAVNYNAMQNNSKAFSDYNCIVNYGDNDYYFLALKERAKLYEYYGKTDKALDDFILLNDEDPTDVEINTAIGFMYSKKLEYDLALIYYNKALDIDPNNVDALHKRAIAYQEKMLPENALDDINKAIILDNSITNLYLTRALIYKSFDKKDLALIDYDYVIMMEPENGLAYLNRAYLKQELSDKKGANDDFKKAKALGHTP